MHKDFFLKTSFHIISLTEESYSKKGNENNWNKTTKKSCNKKDREMTALMNG